jgi:hypothetical protein
MVKRFPGPVDIPELRAVLCMNSARGRFEFRRGLVVTGVALGAR